MEKSYCHNMSEIHLTRQKQTESDIKKKSGGHFGVNSLIFFPRSKNVPKNLADKKWQ